MKKASGAKMKVVCPLGNEKVDGAVKASINGLGLAIKYFNPNVMIATVTKLAIKGVNNLLLFFATKNNNATANTINSALKVSKEIIKIDNCSVLKFNIKFKIWLSNRKLTINDKTNNIYPFFINKYYLEDL